MNSFEKGVDRQRKGENRMREAYFQWMIRLVDRPAWSGRRSWQKLFRLLHRIDFLYILELDANRADDGTDLRYRFAYEHGYDGELVKEFLDKGPCTMLEMMIALAQRCEEHIMDDPDSGDRTGKWFFEMIESLGLGSMDDEDFDEDFVMAVIDRFLRREYDRDGRGGLFTVSSCRFDMRRAEIWYQMMWYLNEFVYGGR